MAATARIMLVAGEPSGDVLGGQLMAALQDTRPGAISHVAFSGVGGPSMSRQGLHSLFPLADIAVMGVSEVVPRLAVIFDRLRKVTESAISDRPDVLVIIDSPDFTHRLARKVAAHAPDVMIVNYVAPQVWAWRQGRARRMGRYIDHLLTLLPFEKPFFEEAGLRTTFVGHPVLERVASEQAAKAFRAAHHIGAEAPVLLLLPGSRRSEIDRHLEIFGHAAALLKKKLPALEVVLPTVEHLHEDIAGKTAAWPLHVHLVSGTDKAAAMKAGNVALAASGTVSLELGACGVPMVIGYRVSAVTAFIYRLAVRLPSVVLLNLVAGENTVPELLQDDLTPERACAALFRLLDDERARAAQLEIAARAVASLRAGGESPSQNAARAIWADIAEARADLSIPAGI